MTIRQGQTAHPVAKKAANKESQPWESAGMPAFHLLVACQACFGLAIKVVYVDRLCIWP